MVKINLDNFRRSDRRLFVPQPKVYFDDLCFEYGEGSIDDKLEILSELIANGLDFVSEIERYIGRLFTYHRRFLSGISTFVDINVDRCFFYAGNAGMWRMVYGLMIPLGGGIYSNNPNDKFEVVNATVVDKDNHLIAIAKYIGNPSNRVTFCTENINVSEMFGDENTYDFDYVFQKLSEFKFLIGYKYNGGSEIYWEYVDIDGGSNVKI